MGLPKGSSAASGTVSCSSGPRDSEASIFEFFMLFSMKTITSLGFPYS